MSDEQDKLKLSLEPPKLFGRKKKAAGAAAASDSATSEATRPTEPVAQDDVDAATGEEAQAAPEEVPDEEPEEVPGVEQDTAVEPEREPMPADESEAAPAAADLEPADAEDLTDTEPAEPSAPVAGDVPAQGSKQPPAKPAGATAVTIEPEPVSEAALEDADIAARLKRRSRPMLAMYPAAAVTGFVVGAAMVMLTWLSLRGCEAVRGTASCGGGPGFLLLIATFAICVLLGSALLKAFVIPDPGSSSFLAVGLVAVVALLFLIDLLDHWSMLIVVPLLSVAAYLASVWVTKTFVEPAET